MAGFRPAQAQAVCGSYQSVVDNLKKGYAEDPVAAGLTLDGGVVEVFSSAAKGTWTMVVVQPSGLTCLIAAGKGWEILPPAPGEPAVEERKI